MKQHNNERAASSDGNGASWLESDATGKARVKAPGRVNLIGDHTDYTGGLVMPMAIDRYTEITFCPDSRVVLTSADEAEAADLALSVVDASLVEPGWARLVAGVIAEMHPKTGIRGHVSTSIPIGAGLSSSAALEIVVAIALGHRGDAVSLAQLCQRAEHRAYGVPSGIMDQLSIATGRAGHALLIDCHELTVTPTLLPTDVDVVVQYIAKRTLEGSPYADRVAECTAAEQMIGPLRQALIVDVKRIGDPIIRARARHVVTENQRVRDFADALIAGDLVAAGQLMVASHASLRDDYSTSTAAMDAAVDRATRIPGVYGARMTGGGFGGCIVAICEPGAMTDGWVVAAVDGASPPQPASDHDAG